MDDEIYFEGNYLQHSSSSHSQATVEIAVNVDEEFGVLDLEVGECAGLGFLRLAKRCLGS